MKSSTNFGNLSEMSNVKLTVPDDKKDSKQAKIAPSQSTNSMASDSLDIDSNAIIGDYDMKRSASTQAFVIDQLLSREQYKRKKLNLSAGKHIPLTALLQDDDDGETNFAADVISQTSEIFMEGVDSIVDDNFWKCFQPNKPPPWNWNLYLGPLWALGVLIRYLVLFPLRLIVFLLGWVLFGIGMLIVQGLIPAGNLRTGLEHSLISFQCGVFTLTWGAVIRFHGSEGRPEGDTNCVYVANHTSMIDVIILQQSRCFSLVGQRHKGIVKFLQEVVLGCMQCIWFDRGEIKDRAVVAQRLTEHAKDVSRPPLLVFPEGTCVNNEYCIQFKKGVFELGVPIAPVAIKYNKMFVDPFWNSREQSFVMHLFELMTSWCLICDVWYLEPQTRQENESAVEFAARVKKMISKAGGLKDVDWDGYMKYWKPSKRYLDSRQKRNAERLSSIYNYHMQHQYEADGSLSPFAAPLFGKPAQSAIPSKGQNGASQLKQRKHLPSTVEE